jgi:hypothetical protein
MTVQDDREAGQTEKPEPTDENKKKAAEMMVAYEEDRPTVVLPGSGGSISGTAVNDWLDDDGNPKFNDIAGSDEDTENDQAKKDQIEKDKAWNDELRKAAAAENKGEKR